MFDFKRGTTADESNVAVIFSIVNIIVGFFSLFYIRFIPSRILIYVAPFVFFLFVGFISGLLREQSLYPLAAKATPLLMFINMVIFVSCYARNNDEQTQLLDTVIFFSISSAIWKVAFIFSHSGLDLNTVRYQIISGSVTIIFAYAVTGLLFERRKLVYIAAVVSLGVVGISVTRTYLVVFALSGLCLILLLPKQHISKTMFRLISVAGILIIVTSINPELAERWIFRITTSSDVGFDLTGATRLAEATYQINLLGSDLSGLFFGFGMNAETHFAGKYALLIQDILGDYSLDFQGNGYGHIFYVGLIYVGGIFAGGGVILALVIIVILASKELKRVWTISSDEEKYIGLFGISASLGYIGYGFLGGTWGDRSMSFFFGVAIGLSLSVIRRGSFMTADNRTIF